MKTAQPIGVGLLGMGVVGSGVARALESYGESLAGSIGASLEVRKVLVRDVHKTRDVDFPSHKLTSDVQQVLDDPAIQVVVELIGGEVPARDYIKKALQRGKHVVTANKEVMAKDGPNLLELADSNRALP